AEGQGPAGGAAAAPGADPADLQQEFHGAAREADAPNLLDFGSSDGLVVRDNRQRLHRRFGQLAGGLAGFGDAARQVRRGLEAPGAPCFDKLDAAFGVVGFQLHEHRGDVDGGAQLFAEGFGGDRFAASEKQRFGGADGVGAGFGARALFSAFGEGVLDAAHLVGDRGFVLSTHSAPPFWTGLARTNSGANASACRSSSLASRASSSAAPNVEAR